MAKLSQLKGTLKDSVTLEYDLGVTVDLRPMPNPQFDAYMAKLKRPQLRKLRRGGASGDEMNELVKEAIAHTVITGWGGLEKDDGTPDVFSPERALAFFQDPALYDFYSFVRTEAADVGNFLAENKADATGN